MQLHLFFCFVVVVVAFTIKNYIKRCDSSFNSKNIITPVTPLIAGDLIQ